MKIQEFHSKTGQEAVILHTTKGKGRKKRRFTVAATVVNGKLFVAKSQCGYEDQFQKSTGVSHALGKLTSTLVNHTKNTMSKITERYGELAFVVSYPKTFDRKEILQVINVI